MAKILVVDDDKELRTVMKGVLELEGFQVCEAHNGLKALEVFRNDIRPHFAADLIKRGCSL